MPLDSESAAAVLLETAQFFHHSFGFLASGEVLWDECLDSKQMAHQEAVPRAVEELRYHSIVSVALLVVVVVSVVFAWPELVSAVLPLDVVERICQASGTFE